MEMKDIRDEMNLFDRAQQLLNLAEIAQRYGLISLKSEVAKYQRKPFILEKGIELIIQGLSAEQIIEILNNYVIINSYMGDSLIEARMIIGALVCIQRGERYDYIRELLMSFVPIDEQKKLVIKNKEKVMNKLIELYLYSIDINEDKALCQLLGELDSQELTKVLSTIEIQTLIQALYGLNKETLVNILSKIDYNLIRFMMENLNDRKISHEGIEEAHHILMGLIA